MQASTPQIAKKPSSSPAEVDEISKHLELQFHTQGEILMLDYKWLQYKYASESEVMGPHIFGRCRTYLEGLAQATKENRDLFVDFWIANSWRILNTDFHKPPAKQATFRENTTPIGCAHYTAENDAQLDFFLTRQKHRNQCTDVQSRYRFVS